MGSLLTFPGLASLDPFAVALIAGASRTYAADLWWYIIEVAYGATLAVMVFLSVLPVIRPRRTSRAIGSPTPQVRSREGIFRPIGR